MNLKSKKRVAFLLALIMAFTMSITTTAFANEEQGYLAMGADLSDAEKATVYDLLGVSDPAGYNIITVTNSEEHKYLDSYVDTNQIGDKALSSVLIRENSGDEINVETHNIGYCTSGMYENALSTAGVTGADVVVAGPFEISGTAALVGTVKAYEEMTGKTVDEDVLEGAVDEITTTGELGEEIGSMDAASDIVSDVKEEMADNPDMSDSELEETIREAAQDSGYDLSEGAVENIKGMTQNLQGLDIDWSGVKNLLDADKAKGFFQKIVDWFTGLVG